MDVSSVVPTAVEYREVYKKTTWISQIQDKTRFPSECVRIVLTILYIVGVIITGGLLLIEQKLNLPRRVRVPVDKPEIKHVETEPKKPEFKFDPASCVDVKENKELSELLDELEVQGYQVKAGIPDEVSASMQIHGPRTKTDDMLLNFKLDQRKMEFGKKHVERVKKLNSLFEQACLKVAEHFARKELKNVQANNKDQLVGLAIARFQVSNKGMEFGVKINTLRSSTFDGMALKVMREKEVEIQKLMMEVLTLAETITKEEVIKLIEIEKEAQKLLFKEESVYFFDEKYVTSSDQAERGIARLDGLVKRTRSYILENRMIDLGQVEKSGQIEEMYKNILGSISKFVESFKDKYKEIELLIYPKVAEEFFEVDEKGCYINPNLKSNPLEEESASEDLTKTLDELHSKIFKSSDRVEMHNNFMAFVEEYSKLHEKVVSEIKEKIETAKA